MKNFKFLLFLFILNLIFFLPYFIKPQLLTTLDNDLGRTYVPLYSFIADSFKNYGQIPLWRPDQMMGDSFIGNPLSSLLYPINIIFAFIPTQTAIIIYLFLHFLLAAISTYFLANTFRFTTIASLAAAIFYVFSTKMLVHLEAGHITMVAAFSYFPLLFLATRKILEKGSLGYLIIMSLSLAAMYIVYPTIFFYAVVFIAVYLFYKLTLAKSPKKFTPFIFVVLVAAGILAATLIPQIEYGPISTRSQLSFTDVAIPTWNSQKLLEALIFPYTNLKNFNHEEFLYLGIVPLIFSALGFFQLRFGQKIFLAVSAITAILFISGQSSPVFKIAYELVPFLKYTRVTTRVWFAVAMVVALLAAYGLTKIKNQKIIFLAIIVFITEVFFIYSKRIKNISSLNFVDESIYQFLAHDKDIFRIYCTTYCFNPQLLSKYQLNLLAGETPIQNANFVKFLELAGNYQYDHFAVIFPPYQIWQVENPPVPNSQLLGSANVKYVASSYNIGDENFKFIEKFNNIYLFENENFRQRYSFENQSDKVTVLRYSPNSIDVSFKKADVYRELIISENYYPGWLAKIDGQKFPVERANQFFKKVRVPPNTDLVQIKYEPPSLLAGKTITIGTILFLLMYFWYTRNTRNKLHG